MPRCALVGLAGLIGTLPAWADSGNPACVSTNGSNCQIGLTANPAGHGQTGPTQQPDPITYDFTNQQTLNAGNGAGAVDFVTVAGEGGAANHDGMNGGTGGGIGTSQAPVSIGPVVTVGGAGGVYVDIEGGLTSSYAGSPGLMRPRTAAAATATAHPELMFAGPGAPRITPGVDSDRPATRHQQPCGRPSPSDETLTR